MGGVFDGDVPDEVLWEISHDWDLEADPYLCPPSNGMSRERKKIACKRCGYGNLMWVEHNYKWTLAYRDGELKGKLHACPY